jgi:uncharacterized protein (TIGR03083 family)
MVDYGVLYLDARSRCIAVVREHLDAWATPVPACPGWDVHAVVSHLLGGLEDGGGSGPGGIPTPDDTAAQVARRRDVPLGELLDRWEAAGPAVDRYLSAHPDAPLAGPAVLDTVSHEHDIRGALGAPGGRDAPAIEPMVGRVLRFLSVPAPLVVRVVDAEQEHHAEIRVGPAGDDRAPVVLTTTRFDALRWRFGRRSPAQLAAMDWSADPTPFLPHLCIFGPADTDIVE